MNKVEQLFQVDRSFCLDCQTNKENAWMKYTADHSLMGTINHLPYINDNSQIRESIKKVFELDHISFIWEPLHGFISDDETLGVTTGIYTRTFLQDGKQIIQKGKYMTTWKKIGTEWKIVFDMGN